MQTRHLVDVSTSKWNRSIAKIKGHYAGNISASCSSVFVGYDI
jgi:hypothetical protein